MAIAVAGTPTTAENTGTSSTTLTISYPTGVSSSGSNEILVLIVRMINNSATAITLPTNWTAWLQRAGNNTPAFNQSLICWKESNSESGTLDVTLPGGFGRPHAVMFRLSGVDVSAIGAGDTDYLETSLSTTSVPMPTALSTADNDATLWVVGVNNPFGSWGDTASTAPPSGVTEQIDQAFDGGAIGVGFDDDASQADPGDWTFTRTVTTSRPGVSFGVGLAEAVSAVNADAGQAAVTGAGYDLSAGVAASAGYG